MTTPLSAPVTVDAPAPELPAYGLQAAATVITNPVPDVDSTRDATSPLLTTEQRAALVGVQFQSDNCSQASGWDMSCGPPFLVQFTKNSGEGDLTWTVGIAPGPLGSYEISINGGAFATAANPVTLPASPDPATVVVREAAGLGRSVTVSLSPTADPSTVVLGSSGTQAANPDKAAAADDPVYTGTPFTITDAAPCASLLLNEAETRAVRRLSGSEWRRVEQAVWNGDLGNTPYLANPAAVAAGAATAQPLKQGLAALESALGRFYNGTGVIHLPRWVAPYLADRMQLVPDGAVARTPLRTRYAFHSHNVNPGPNGQTPADGEFYAYATGAVLIRRTDVDVPASPQEGGFDWRRNRNLTVAERSYVVTFDCPPVFYALITLAGEDPAPAA